MDVRDRLLGYRKAMREAGLEARVVYGDLEEEGGHRAAAEAFRRYPDTTALFAANDQTAFGARLYLYEQGLRVPEDVSLMGFDDIALSAYQIPRSPPCASPSKTSAYPGPRAPGGPRGGGAHPAPPGAPAGGKGLGKGGGSLRKTAALRP